MARNPNDITAYRKSNKIKDNLAKMLIIAVVIFVIFFIWTNGEDVFAPLRNIGSRAESEGFPISLSGSASYEMNHFGTGFLLLSDTYLYTFTDKGGRIFAHRHNYARPFQKANDRRILLCNLNGYEFSLFNRSGRLFEVKLDDRIVLIDLGINDMSAVVTTSAAFSNILYIYDGNGRLRYTRRFIEEEVNAVTFTSKSHEIIVATSSVRNGEIFSKIYRLRTDTEESVMWERALPADAWALNLRENGEYITVLADNAIFSLDSENGRVIGSYSFEQGQLVRPVFGTSFNLIVLQDYVTRRPLFITLDAESNFIKSEIMPFEAKKVEISGEMVYTLTGSIITIHDSHLVQTGSVSFEDEYWDFITAGGNALLLGFDTIEQASLQ